LYSIIKISVINNNFFATISYLIEDLPVEGAFLLTVTLSVCLEANANCAVQRLVANSLKLDKPTCISSDQFAIPGKYH
jgi:hypothetical protein